MASTIRYIYDATPGTHSQDNVFDIIHLTAFTGVTWTAGLAFVVHISVMVCSKLRKSILLGTNIFLITITLACCQGRQTRNLRDKELYLSQPSYSKL